MNYVLCAITDIPNNFDRLADIRKETVLLWFISHKSFEIRILLLIPERRKSSVILSKLVMKFCFLVTCNNHYQAIK
jgi:hypothetical protein